MVEAVRICVQGLSSYRVAATLLGDRLGVRLSPFTVNRWVDDAGGRAMRPVEVSALLSPPAWSGFLGVDGKAIWVRGEERCLLVAVDQGTQDIIHALVVEREGEDGFERIVRESVTIGNYPLKALVIDAAQPFVGAYLKYFARLPMQLCCIHASRRLDYEIRSGRGTPGEARRSEFKARIRAVLFAPSEQIARERFERLYADRHRYAGLGYKRVDAIRALGRRFDHYMTHHHVEGLPADTNITENVIKQLAKKLRLMEGFQSMPAADRFMRLLVGCYRFKRFTTSCRPHHVGRAPLELAGIDIDGIDWIRFHLRQQQQK